MVPSCSTLALGRRSRAVWRETAAEVSQVICQLLTKDEARVKRARLHVKLAEDGCVGTTKKGLSGLKTNSGAWVGQRGWGGENRGEDRCVRGAQQMTDSYGVAAK